MVGIPDILQPRPGRYTSFQIVTGSGLTCAVDKMHAFQGKCIVKMDMPFDIQ